MGLRPQSLGVWRWGNWVLLVAWCPSLGWCVPIDCCASPVSGMVWGGAGDPAMEQWRGLGVSDTSGGLEGTLGR